MSAEKRMRLPPELLAEMVSAMPAGIVALEGATDFMERMQPLAAFIRPRMRKFRNKSKGQDFNKFSKLEELQQACGQIAFEVLNATTNSSVYYCTLQLQLLEFFRHRSAIEKLEKELAEEWGAEWSNKYKAYKSAWKCSIELANALATGKYYNKADKKNGQGISNGGGGGQTVCEASSSRKRKNLLLIGNEEEPTEEIDSKVKKGRLN